MLKIAFERRAWAVRSQVGYYNTSQFPEVFRGRWKISELGRRIRLRLLLGSMIQNSPEI